MVISILIIAVVVLSIITIKKVRVYKEGKKLPRYRVNNGMEKALQHSKYLVRILGDLGKDDTLYVRIIDPSIENPILSLQSSNRTFLGKCPGIMGHKSSLNSKKTFLMVINTEEEWDEAFESFLFDEKTPSVLERAQDKYVMTKKNDVEYIIKRM